METVTRGPCGSMAVLAGKVTHTTVVGATGGALQVLDAL